MIVRTHLKITAQVNSVVVEIASVRDVPWLTLKSIRSGRNLLLICLAYLFLTIPIAVEMVAVVIRKEMLLPDSYTFAAVWIMMCNSSANSLIYIGFYHSIPSKAVAMVTGWYNSIVRCMVDIRRCY